MAQPKEPYTRPSDTTPDEEKRAVKRLDLRPSDGVRIVSIGDFRGDLRVFDFSVGGFCVLMPEVEVDKLNQDSVYNVEFSFPDLTSLVNDSRFAWVAPFKEGLKKVGFRLEQHPPNNIPMPKYTIDVPDLFPIVGAVYKPHLYFERAVVKMVTFADSYLVVEFADSEIIMFPGVKYELFISSPTVDFLPIALEVLEVTPSGSKRIRVKSRVLSMPKRVDRWIGQFLVYHLELAPQQVRELGFSVREVSNSFRFRFVKSDVEYQEVLKLRYLAYKSAGKVPEGKTYQDMAAPLDSFSRILIAFHGEKIVGTVAIAFPPHDKMLLDTERGFKNGYPKAIPPKTQLVEVARLCTDPEYRGTDLMLRLLEFIYKTSHCGGRRYFLTSTDETLWRLYKKFGFKKLGMAYDHPFLAGIRHQIIMADRLTGDQASAINPLAWNYVWRDMSQFLARQGSRPKNPLRRVYVKIISSLGRKLKINLKEKS